MSPPLRLTAATLGLALVQGTVAAGCSGGVSPLQGEPPIPDGEGGEGAAVHEEPLDWALLLPIETDGLLRVDLERLRRSPHRSAMEPLLSELLGEFGAPELRETMRAIIDRTDVLLVALLPALPGRERELMALARGEYRRDETRSLGATPTQDTPTQDTPTQGAIVEVRDRTVWLDRSGEDSLAVAQIRPDTLALTSSVERMDRLLARTEMTQSGPRWPPAVRPLVQDAALELEASTLSMVLSRNTFRGGPEGMSMAITGRADVDGPLHAEIVVDFDEPSMAQMAAMAFQGILQGMAQSTGPEAFTMRRVASLARIETQGSRVVGSLNADESTAAQLIPSLIEMLGRHDDHASPESDGTPTTPL